MEGPREGEVEGVGQIQTDCTTCSIIDLGSVVVIVVIVIELIFDAAHVPFLSKSEQRRLPSTPSCSFRGDATVVSFAAKNCDPTVVG